jgi:5-methyltetrahydropteroyltriglutamate--homocysteine methyltransferase
LEIGLGCVDVTPGQVDSPETIAARVRQALQFLAPERITLNPDCGFAPGSGAAVSLDETYRKLCNEAKAARMLREEFA